MAATTAPTRRCSPFPKGAPLGRLDAGIDYARAFHGPLVAIGDSTVEDIVPVGPGHSWGGLGRVKFKLDQPITIRRGLRKRTYDEWYSAEAADYFVMVGQRVKAGEEIGYTKSGWQETGFVGSQSFNEQAPTEEARDFLAFVKACEAADQPVWDPRSWWSRWFPGFRPF